jgi:hypothetical protein
MAVFQSSGKVMVRETRLLLLISKIENHGYLNTRNRERCIRRHQKRPCDCLVMAAEFNNDSRFCIPEDACQLLKYYGKPDSQPRFWNGMSRPLASACDAVATDLEHYFPR